MNVLVIGSGGREHALCWKLSRSDSPNPTRRVKLFCAPGNAGISQIAQCIPISADNLAALRDFAKQEKIDLTVVGPEAPLVAGIVDLFRDAGLKIFGPTRAAAQLEGSKAFSKRFMQKYGIPTARFTVHTILDDAIKSLAKYQFPLVVKASGLAAGKGVIICQSRAEAEAALHGMLSEHRFGDAGASVVIEECLIGEESSILAITDGEEYFCLPASQDHKRLLDGDQGPNTGGMGAYAPAPVITPQLQAQVEKEILQLTLAGMREEGMPFTGCLYIGLMITKDGPKVLEYNARFGDPETQAVLPLYDGDLLEACLASATGDMRGGQTFLSVNPSGQAGMPDLPKDAVVCVVLASGGYPGSYEKGKPITGLDAIPDGVVVFHAGTKLKDNQIVTDGGRVLGVTARAENLKAAVELAYRGVEAIRFEGKTYRKDIGKKALKKL
ncbi:MAG TPA: phosphoribosylamine--glycine ligase [bacterium]